MSSYKEYYYSDERQIGRGLLAIGVGIVACCVPGGQGVGAVAIAKGVFQVGKTTAVSAVKDEIKKKKNS